MKPLIALLLTTTLAAAQHTSPLAPGEHIPNLDTLKARITAYHDCSAPGACYSKDLDLQADRAIAFLKRRAAHSRPGEKLALVLDIDETSLLNYEEYVSNGFAWDEAKFDAWVDAAKAPAIPGTVRLCKEAQRLGVSIFFISGRPETQRSATEQNMRAAGYDAWQKIVLRQPNEVGQIAQVFKSAARARIVAQGYKIVLNVGDQWSDLHGNPVAEYSVKYPDPFYFLK